jgi:hypothetical protein
VASSPSGGLVHLRQRVVRRSHAAGGAGIYSHLMPNMQADAVARVDDVLQNAMLRRKAGEGTENKR